MELLTETQLLIFKVAVITGWTLPNDESYMQVLVDQFAKKLREDYPYLNSDEIEHAFRKSGTTTKDWGKAFNLSLIDQVLIPYVNARNDVNEFVSRMHVEESKQLTYEGDWKKVCEVYYQDYLKGSFNIKLFPAQMYDEFVNSNMMEHDVYTVLLKEAFYVLIDKQPETLQEAKELNELKAEKYKHPQVIRVAKALGTALLFHEAKARGMKNLFYVIE
jgi:hypothetical protein